MNTQFQIGVLIFKMTTEHAASSYGQPVLIHENIAYGWDDEVKGWGFSAKSVAAAALGDGHITREEFNRFAGLPESFRP